MHEHTPPSHVDSASLGKALTQMRDVALYPFTIKNKARLYLLTKPHGWNWSPNFANLKVVFDPKRYINEKKREADNALRVVEIQSLLTGKGVPVCFRKFK